MSWNEIRLIIRDWEEKLFLLDFSLTKNNNWIEQDIYKWMCSNFNDMADSFKYLLMQYLTKKLISVVSVSNPGSFIELIFMNILKMIKSQSFVRA